MTALVMDLCCSPCTTMCRCLCFLRHMVACNSVTLHAHLHLCCLQLWLLTVFRPHTDHLDAKLLIMQSALASLMWWTDTSKVMKGICFAALFLSTMTT